MVQYVEREDRKILQARQCEVIEVHVIPHLVLRLTGDVCLEFSGRVLHTTGARTEENPGKDLAELAEHELSSLLFSKPLSWVVFNTGNQRIVFSNHWHLALKASLGDTWRLELGHGRTLTYPPIREID
ncbi:hypothetical protein ACH35V_08400 [Actinomadura sp. 1N219]|uniref:hypothetical protein n=1 Tax=Actinomadura sp. 1N219 TaxID=3375152 RepID=UPI0037AAB44F